MHGSENLPNMSMPSWSYNGLKKPSTNWMNHQVTKKVTATGNRTTLQFPFFYSMLYVIQTSIDTHMHFNKIKKQKSTIQSWILLKPNFEEQNSKPGQMKKRWTLENRGKKKQHTTSTETQASKRLSTQKQD